jgi:hypothetical protein
LNTRVWLSTYEVVPEYIALVANEADVIDGTWSVVGRTYNGLQMGVFTPIQPFEPDTEYALYEYGQDVAQVFAELASGERETLGRATTRFRTGSLVDSEPPAVPTAELSEVSFTDDPAVVGGGSNCEVGSFIAASASFSVSPPADILVADLNGAADLDVLSISGTASFIEGFSPTVGVGTSMCGARWLDARDGDTGAVRFGTFDFAGNFSGWSETSSFEFASEPPAPAAAEPAGCSFISDRESLPWALFVALLAAIRRTRRPRFGE